MPDFQVYPIERFAQAGAAIKRPSELTYFSYDENHVQHHDARSLHYYYPPELGSSLSEGFDTFRKIDDTDDEHLDGLLSSLVRYEQRGVDQKLEDQGNGEKDLSSARPDGQEDPPGNGDAAGLAEQERGAETSGRVEADFITWRGMMTKIMTAPYTNFDGFEMNATLFQDTIFIEENHEAKLTNRTKQEAQRPRHGIADQEMMSYWGHKFETLSLLPDTWVNTPRSFIESRSSHVTSNYEQFVSVAQTGIGDIKLILGGEVDGVWDTHPSIPVDPPPLLSSSQSATVSSATRPSYLELKTAAEHPPHSNQRDFERFDRKLLKFWAQSFLLGVPRIIVGFRTNDMEGRLLRIQEFATTALPRVVREGARSDVAGKKEPTWEMAVCVNFAGEFLKFVKSTITAQSSDGGVWKIRRHPRSPVIEVTKVEESGYGDILSQEFITWRTTGDVLETKKAGMLDRWGVKMATRARDAERSPIALEGGAREQAVPEKRKRDVPVEDYADILRSYGAA